MQKGMWCAAALAVALVPAGAYADELAEQGEAELAVAQDETQVLSSEDSLGQSSGDVGAPSEAEEAENPGDVPDGPASDSDPDASPEADPEPGAAPEAEPLSGEDGGESTETLDAETVEGEAASEEVAADGATTAAAGDAVVAGCNMYRLYNPNTGEHFYTSSLDEAASVVEAGWRYEGVGWVAPSSSSTPVYRLYNPNAGDHHYTTSAKERDQLVAAGWKYEGIGWYSDDAQGAAVLRQYNSNARSGAHNFTTSTKENSTLVSAGWSSEGVGWYATGEAAQAIEGRWLVTSAWGSLERYWLGQDAKIAKSRLVTPDEGASYYAYAKSDGSVVRGKYDSDAGLVYVADSDGRLASSSNGETGWLVTGDYDGGSLHRYYYDAESHAMKTGFYVVEGYGSVYGLGEVGYVLCGKGTWGDHVFLANADGKLETTSGWLVTTAYDAEIQRYYMELVPGIGDFYGAKTGFFSVSGSDYYATSDQGYVVRSGWYFISEKSLWYHADDDVKLAVLEGGKVGYQNPSNYPQVSAYTVVLPSYATGYWTYVMPCMLRPDATRSDCVETFISAAMKYLGTRWVDNCAGEPGTTIDCTGLVMEALYACGMDLTGARGGDYNPYSKHYWNHSFANTWRNNQTFMAVSLGSLQRGDLIYWNGHVAIYLGNDRILDSNSVNGTTLVHSYSGCVYGTPLGAARPFV